MPAPNVPKRSLFAILTELPWWFSLLVAALIYALGALFNPLMGAAAALPFVGVAMGKRGQGWSGGVMMLRPTVWSYDLGINSDNRKALTLRAGTRGGSGRLGSNYGRGAYVGIDNGYFQGEIADAAYQFEKLVNRGERIVVGVNAFTDGNEEAQPDLLQITSEQEMAQIKRLQAVKSDRDAAAVQRGLDELRTAAADPERNLMPSLIDAVQTFATEGEIMNALADVFGRYVERPVI